MARLEQKKPKFNKTYRYKYDKSRITERGQANDANRYFSRHPYTVRTNVLYFAMWYVLVLFTVLYPV